MCSSQGSHRFTVRGSPIRTSTDHGMCAPPRRFSQLTTSFLASARLGIHRVPLVACQPNFGPSANFSQELELSSLDDCSTSPSLGIYFLFNCQRASTASSKSKTPIARNRRRRETLTFGSGSPEGQKGISEPIPLRSRLIDVSKLDRRVSKREGAGRLIHGM